VGCGLVPGLGWESRPKLHGMQRVKARISLTVPGRPIGPLVAEDRSAAGVRDRTGPTIVGAGPCSHWGASRRRGSSVVTRWGADSAAQPWPSAVVFAGSAAGSTYGQGGGAVGMLQRVLRRRQRQPPTIPPPAEPGTQERVIWDRLGWLIEWYGSHSSLHESLYIAIKLLQITIAALIPVFTSYTWYDATAWSGATIVVLEGIQQLFRFQERWILWRDTNRLLLREEYLFYARAGRYADVLEPFKVLAERIEELSVREFAQQRTIIEADKRAAKAKDDK
jgi:hypothetical protein